MDINIRVAGEAGQGVLTTGGLLVQSFASLGLNVAAARCYRSPRSGATQPWDFKSLARWSMRQCGGGHGGPRSLVPGGVRWLVR